MVNTTAGTLSDAPSPDAQRAASATDDRGRLLAADGTPLKASLARALRQQKLRALGLVAPLLLFVLLTFLAPIGDMLFRSVQNDIVPDTLPRTVDVLGGWDASSGELPGDAAFEAVYQDLAVAVEAKDHTKLGSRLNYASTGMASMFRKSDAIYLDLFKDVDRKWTREKTFVALFVDGDAAGAFPKGAAAYEAWSERVRARGEDPLKEDPWDPVYKALYDDVTAPNAALAAYSGPMAELVVETVEELGEGEPLTIQQAFAEADKGWVEPETWATFKQLSGRYTDDYFLTAADYERGVDGEIQPKPDDEAIYLFLFERTLCSRSPSPSPACCSATPSPGCSPTSRCGPRTCC